MSTGGIRPLDHFAPFFFKLFSLLFLVFRSENDLRHGEWHAAVVLAVEADAGGRDILHRCAAAALELEHKCADVGDGDIAKGDIVDPSKGTK
jgi:hypothetical protein